LEKARPFCVHNVNLGCTFYVYAWPGFVDEGQTSRGEGQPGNGMAGEILCPGLDKSVVGQILTY